jgi:hypothetical protein
MLCQGFLVLGGDSGLALEGHGGQGIRIPPPFRRCLSSGAYIPALFVSTCAFLSLKPPKSQKALTLR